MVFHLLDGLSQGEIIREEGDILLEGQKRQNILFHGFNSMVQSIFCNREGLSLITDWKLPCSKMNKKMIESNLSILGELDVIKCVITDAPEDWEEFERICKSGTKAKLYLSPCFGEVTMSRIPEFVIAHPEYKITAQLQQHKFFWSPKEKDV